MSNDMDEQLKVARKVVHVVSRANREICVTMLLYNVDKLESSYAQVWIFTEKKENEKFQKNFCVTYKLDEVIYLLYVMISVYDNVFTNQSICNVP